MKRWLLLCAFVLVFVISAGVFFLSAPLSLRSDPNLAREAMRERYEKGTSSTPPLEASVSASILSVVSNATSIDVEYLMEKSPDDFPGMKRVDANRELEAVLGDYKFRLKLIGVGYGEFKEDPANSWAAEVEGRYFRPDLQPMAAEEVEGLLSKWERTLRYRGTFPAVRWLFEMEGTDQAEFMGGDLYNANTLMDLTDGLSWSGNANLRLDMDLGQWHASPLDLVIDMAVGPAEEFFMAPKVGERVDYGAGQLELLAVIEGDTAGTSTRSSGGGTNHLSVNIRKRSSGEEGRDELNLVFLGAPMTHGAPIQVSALKADGEELNNAGGSNSSVVMTKSFRGSVGDVDRIRVRYFPNLYRVVFRLPTVPGLPEENRGVENLFDVRAKHVRLRNVFELRGMIGGLVQLDMQGQSPSSPPGYLFSAEEATAEELIAEYLTLVKRPSAPKLNMETGTLEIGDPWYKRLAKKFEEIFR